MTKKRNIKNKYLIIGQGLAGTILTWKLLQQGHEVIIIDQNHQHASSKIAAGLINPITGRRFVKSWMIDELLPAAKKTYQNIEAQENISIFHERDFMWVLENVGDENEFSRREGDESYVPYIAESKEVSDWIYNIKNSDHRKFLNQCAQVDLPSMIQHFQSKWVKEGILRVEKFEYKDLQPTDDGIVYKDLKANKIIFCEGNRATQNPHFNNLHFNISKGEVLIAKIPNLQSSMIIKNGVTIAPIDKELFWIGSTFTWKEENDFPSREGKKSLVEKLQNAVTTPFEIVDHLAAFRPTVFDRRPLMGAHPEFNNYLIFNGFGSKGASLVPYWASQFVDFLANTKELSKEVSILRKNAIRNPMS